MFHSRNKRSCSFGNLSEGGSRPTGSAPRRRVREAFPVPVLGFVHLAERQGRARRAAPRPAARARVPRPEKAWQARAVVRAVGVARARACGRRGGEHAEKTSCHHRKGGEKKQPQYAVWVPMWYCYCSAFAMRYAPIYLTVYRYNDQFVKY